MGDRLAVDQRAVDLDRSDALTAKHPALAPGERFGRFEVMALLGSGGTAVIYEVQDLESGDRLALKVPRGDLAFSPEVRDALLSEARFTASVSHPGVVQVHGYGQSPTDECQQGISEPHGPPETPPHQFSPGAWIAMELLPGTTLSQYVREHGPLSVDDALVFAEGLLDAVDAVHRAGVVHRDITPANIMIDVRPGERLSSADVHLFDFGLAAEPGHPALSAQGLIWGSAQYLSPEHAVGYPVHPSGDVYQAGAVLYYGLTGRPPFVRETVEDVMSAHVSDPLQAPVVHRSDLPLEVDRVVRRALRKDPGERFGSAQEMRAAVREARLLLRENDVTTAQLVPAARGSTASVAGGAVRPKRGAALLWLLAACVAVLMIGTGMAVAYLGKDEAPRVEVSGTERPTSRPEPTEAPPTAEAPRFAVMPQLVGLSLGEARIALAGVGLLVGQITTSNGVAAAETILAVEHPAGARMPEGTQIALTVASGSNVVPVVGGLTPAEAEATLAAAGFVGSLGLDPTPGADPDLVRRVQASQPGAGSLAAVGSTIAYHLAPIGAQPEHPVDPGEPGNPVDPGGEPGSPGGGGAGTT